MINTPPTHILASLIILAVTALFAFFVNKNKEGKKLTPLASIAFGVILAGLIFGGDKLISYSLIGIGAILVVADIIQKIKE